MKERSLGYLYGKLRNKKERSPLMGQLELTYRCGLNCIHCCCKGMEDELKELSVGEWKEILDEIHKEGCLWVCFTGGDPLIRKDFLEIYAYAKQKGFLVILFTNGYGFNDEIIDYLVKSPPECIEITFNGITKNTHESITQIPDSFSTVLDNIKKIAEKKLKLILKANLLKQNKHEIGRIKAFTEDLLGKPSTGKYYFKYDPLILPRYNGDKAPVSYGLSLEEMDEVREQDADIWEEYQKGLHGGNVDSEPEGDFLYHCNSWMNQFYINPYARLRFCVFSDKFSIDLKETSFREGFYRWPEQILNEKFRTDSKCRTCALRPICYRCPARAYLETGNEELPVERYCRMAEKISKEMSG